MPQDRRAIKQEIRKIGADSGIDEKHGSRDVGRQRHIMHIADSKQALDVGIMRMFAQRIKEEKDGVHAPFRHQLAICASPP